MAGLTRLGMAHLATPIAMEEMLPSAGQGIIGVVARAGADHALQEALSRMDHAETRAAATAERAFLAALDGSCRTPIAAHLFDRGEDWQLIGEVLALDGQQRWRADGSCRKGASQAQLVALGRAVAADIRKAAGGTLPAFVGDL
jgi:hydroxymethylbilane synthase